MHTVGTDASTRPNQEGSALAELRELVPRRPLSYTKALRIAELQAQRLLALAGHENAPKGWPANGQALGNSLRRIAPLLRQDRVHYRKLHHGRQGSLYLIEKRDVRPSVTSVTSLKNGEKWPDPGDTSGMQGDGTPARRR